MGESTRVTESGGPFLVYGGTSLHFVITGLEKSGEPEFFNAQNKLLPPFQWELCKLFGVARRVDDFNRVSTFITVVVGWNREGEYRKEEYTGAGSGFTSVGGSMCPAVQLAECCVRGTKTIDKH